MKIIAKKATQEILKQNNLRLKKRLGQNFLIHEPTVEKIIDAADLKEDDVVVEIGPGIGSLTQQLAETGAKVIAIEIDQRLISILEGNLQFYENVQIVEGDALKINLDELVQEKLKQNLDDGTKKYKVVANLPYYITTPVIMHLLESKFNISDIVVMIQKEVAERLVASPGGKDYGAITASSKYYASTEIVTHVPPEAFIPPPGVNSTVIKLRVREKPPVEVVDERTLFRVIKGAFSQRRKTLLNSLGGAGFGLTKEEMACILDDLEIEGKRRGETLSLEEFAKVSNKFTALSN